VKILEMKVIEMEIDTDDLRKMNLIQIQKIVVIRMNICYVQKVMKIYIVIIVKNIDYIINGEIIIDFYEMKKKFRKE
jgi:16S rRNA A1518/A1519 N6-dimethyltransferase RsmA/KsgA/DIM1 with predicted DNA glycosylase/AP lyase activity